MRALVAIAVLLTASVAHAGPRFLIEGFLTDTANAPITKADMPMRFDIRNQDTQAVIFTESSTVAIKDGFFHALIAAGGGVDAAAFESDQKLELAVSIDGEDAIAISFGYAPYAAYAERAGTTGTATNATNATNATTATTAQAIGTVPKAKVEALFGSEDASCGAAGTFVTGIDAEGKLICEVPSGTGSGVSSILAGTGIAVSSGTGNVTVSLSSTPQAAISMGTTACSAANQSIKTINPATGAVTCETDDNTTGQATITNGTTACSAANQSIKTINPTTGAVTCETDDDTVGQATITNGSTACNGANQSIKTINPTTGAVTCETDDVGATYGAAANGGLAVASNNFSLMNCPAGQILVSTGTNTYACQPDNTVSLSHASANALTITQSGNSGRGIELNMTGTNNGSEGIRVINNATTNNSFWGIYSSVGTAGHALWVNGPAHLPIIYASGYSGTGSQNAWAYCPAQYIPIGGGCTPDTGRTGTSCLFNGGNCSGFQVTGQQTPAYTGNSGWFCRADTNGVTAHAICLHYGR